MKRKLLGLVLAVGLTFSLAACGSGSSQTSEDAGSTATETTDSGAADDAASEDASTESDVDYIKDKGTLVVGITDSAPMDYKDESGEWIGFDATGERRAPRISGVRESL